MKNDLSEKVSTGVVIGGAIFMVLFIFVLFGLYGAWAGAFVGVKLWAWFVAPVFGLPLLTLPQAFGISLLCHFWTWQHFSSKCKDERPAGERIGELVGLVAAPWVTLLFGWVCKTYFLS